MSCRIVALVKAAGRRHMYGDRLPNAGSGAIDRFRPAPSPTAPANTGAPTITPSTGALAGNDLVGAVGTWDWKGIAQGSPAFNIRWERNGGQTAFGGLTYPGASVTVGSYQMFIQAVNANGETSPWVASNVSQVIDVPGAIAAGDFAVTAPSNTQGDVLDLAVNAAPASNGSAITAAEYTLDGGVTSTALPFATTGSHQIQGLTPNTAYSVQVRHQNAAGWGAWSPANSATPTDQVAPTVGSVSIDQVANEIVIAGVSEGGTVYVGIDQSAGAQVGSAIKSGVQGATYAAQGSVVAAAGGTVTVSIDLTGLSAADYYAHVTVEDADTAGLFSADQPTIFTYVPGDVTPPTLTSSVPTDNATGVDPAASIVLTFSETVQLGTGSIELYNVTDAAVVENFDAALGTGSGGGAITASGTDVTINPGANLAAGKSYAIRTIPTGAIQDVAGNSFVGWTNDVTVLNFDTAAASGGPTVRATANTAAASYATVSVNMPAGVAVGDRLVVAIGHQNNATVSAPGWTQIATQGVTSGTSRTLTVFERVADGTEGTTQVFTFSGAWSSSASVAVAMQGATALGTPAIGTGGSFSTYTGPTVAVGANSAALTFFLQNTAITGTGLLDGVDAGTESVAVFGSTGLAAGTSPAFTATGAGATTWVGITVEVQ